MNSQQRRDSVVAVATAAILLTTVWVWQWQTGNDLPQIHPADWFAVDEGDTETPPQVSAIDHDVNLPTKPAYRATPTNSPGTWLTDNDYPVEAARKEWAGTAAFTLVVGTSGSVEGCLINTSSEHAILDEATCATLKRNAHFEPARDMSGVPARDVYKGRITWRLPE